MSNNTQRATWNSKVGFLLAAIGSAVGLGNIWRFSYMAYENGGGAFLIPYAIALVVAGIPLIILEYGLGHKEKGSSPLAFARSSRKWECVGWWMPTVATFGILLFYSVVIGWCINYFIYAFNLSWGADTANFFSATFLKASSSAFELEGINWNIAISTAIVWLVAGTICYKEVNHGIEKACFIFMPMLFVLTAILVFWSLTLPGAVDGIKQYLKPDWDKINIIAHYGDAKVWKVWLDAFGQIFFTLSLGFGIMITYASYLPQKTNIVKNGLITVLANCAYSFFAGFAVFGTLGFMAAQKGVPVDKVVSGGAGLAFVVYPEAINQLPFASNIFGIAFFLTLVIAGLSSAVSLIEAFACSLTDKFSWQRKHTVTGICGAGFLLSLIFTTHAGSNILSIVDHFINHYGLVLGGLLECIFVGYVLKAKVLRKHINDSESLHLPIIWDICIKYITPIILAIILIQAVINDLKKPFEGNSMNALLIFGCGVILITLCISIILARHSWDKAKHFHKKEEDHLLT